MPLHFLRTADSWRLPDEVLWRELPGFHQPGRILPTKGGMTQDMQLDEGVIYLIDSQTREVHGLRGHLGPVLALAFEVDSDGIQVLASAGQVHRQDSRGNRAPSSGFGTWRLESISEASTSTWRR